MSTLRSFGLRTLPLLASLTALVFVPGCPGGETMPGGDGGTTLDGATTDGAPSDGAIDLDGASDVDGGGAGDGGGADGSSPTTCPPEPLCNATPPPFDPTVSWNHSVATPITTAMGSARHRGRDLYLREGDEQWALAKFAYGPFDDDLKDEDVDIYLLRGCTGTSWEYLGRATTTNDGAHATVEGVDDTGGRVYFPIPASATLGIGRHRLLFVVRGDHSTAEQFIEVLPADARFVVTDVDGTQTESETADWTAILGGPSPAAQPYGADVLHAYADRGYRIFYITARPDWLHTHTHEWLDLRGYPPGNVHTTLTGTGALGSAAQSFKEGELAMHLARFPNSIEIAIGNTDTDAGAYATSGMAPGDAYLYQFDPGPIGTRIDDYSLLLPRAESATLVCPF